MNAQHLPETIIAQRYRILKTLGQGGLGITYKAEDLKNGQHVALKTLSLHRMTDWKALELFEREARILESLNHPLIPRYLDYFQVDISEDHSFYLVQQLAPGQSLAALVEEGWHPNEAEVQQLAIQILEILVYLQSLTPPVIHRDIKPQNIILGSPPVPLDKEGAKIQVPLNKGDLGGSIDASNQNLAREKTWEESESNREDCIFLVDFGAVQDTYRHTVMGGSTVVGTYGYMAPEQFRGEAFLSTDLYGLGTTLLFLLTSKSPAELPQRKLKIDFRDRVRVSQNFANWLDKMLEPIVEDRFQTAAEALAVLKGELAFTYSLSRSEKPKGTPIKLTNILNELTIEIPSVWLRNTYSLIFALSPFFPVLSFIVLVLLSTLVVSISVEALLAIAIIFLELYLCSWVPTFSFFFRSLMNVRLKLAYEICSLEWYWLSSLWGTNRMNGNTSDLHQVTLSQLRLPFAREPFTFCVLHLKRRKIRFGLFLTRPENEWLAGEINGFLEKMRSRLDRRKG